MNGDLKDGAGLVAACVVLLPGGSSERRAFPRIALAEAIKLDVEGSLPGAPATYGITTNISRSGIEARIQGLVPQPASRCIVRFLLTQNIKPVAVQGAIVSLGYSSEGHTACVAFETPLEQLKVLKHESPETAEPVRVLVVDDDYHVRKVLRRFLLERGHEVREAKDGQEALNFIREQLPDVLLLDLHMPELDGLEVLQRMRKERLKPKVVLTISGDPDDALARASLHLGAHDFIIKPIQWEYLEWALKLRL